MTEEWLSDLEMRNLRCNKEGESLLDVKDVMARVADERMTRTIMTMIGR